MLGKRLLQPLPKTLTLTHNSQNKQFKTTHARSIDRKKITHGGPCFGAKNWIANLEQTIESIYFLLLLDELRVCGELGFDATSCLEHDLAFRNVRKWFRVTQSCFALPLR